MKVKACAAICVTALVLASQLGAFDNQRKGFVLGAGGGVGFLAAHAAYTYAESTVSPAVNFKMGYAPSNSLEVSYTLALAGPLSVDEGHFVFGVNAITLTSYSKPEGKGWFFTGGLGLAFQSEPGDSRSGFGFIAGVGYELGKHWNIQGDVLYTNVHGKYAVIRLTLNLLGF